MFGDGSEAKFNDYGCYMTDKKSRANEIYRDRIYRCAFCGGEAELVPAVAGKWRVEHYCGDHDRHLYTQWKGSPQEVVDIWNKRMEMYEAGGADIGNDLSDTGVRSRTGYFPGYGAGHYNGFKDGWEQAKRVLGLTNKDLSAMGFQVEGDPGEVDLNNVTSVILRGDPVMVRQKLARLDESPPDVEIGDVVKKGDVRAVVVGLDDRGLYKVLMDGEVKLASRKHWEPTGERHPEIKAVLEGLKGE